MPDDPAAPEPDDKDWTWVPECGFVAGDVEPEAVAGMVRANATEWEQLLAAPSATVRPEPTVWSALEYGAHVRDVHRLYLERLDLMLTQDGPRYQNWDQDETAIAERYHEQDPATVAGEVRAAAEAIATRFESVSGDQWERTGYRSDGAEFTVRSFARYFVHDPIHHVHDVRGA